MNEVGTIEREVVSASRSVQERLVALIGDSDPIDPSGLFEAARGQGLTEQEVHEALWQLIDQQEVTVDENWRIATT